jgi:hypothetical protein
MDYEQVSVNYSSTMLLRSSEAQALYIGGGMARHIILP